MNILKCSGLLFCLLSSLAWGSTTADRHRLIVMADMGNEPDEMQQMIHLMTCSNEIEIEGLIAVTGIFLRPGSPLGKYNWVTHPELFHEIIDAYEKDYPNFQKHAQGWAPPEALRKVVSSGQPEYGIDGIGEGKSSDGSQLIIDVVTREDDRPVWIVVNAGSNTLAQALIDYQREHSPQELDSFVSKIRVFENGAQDNAGAWICKHFPAIHWIRSNYQTYSYGGPEHSGRSTMKYGPHTWKPYEYSVNGQLAWSKTHIMENHGALGAIYPERRFHAWKHGNVSFLEGGGTIPWMGLINRGLFSINHPSWGGWSGRFTVDKKANFWSRHKKIKPDEQPLAPFFMHQEVSDHWVDPESGVLFDDDHTAVWRWRQAMYNDQQCRMDWAVKSFDEANHHPVAAINGDDSDTIIHISASAGETLNFDASASHDPDNDDLNYHWWIYQEAGTYSGDIALTGSNEDLVSFKIPTGAGETQVHLILEIKDLNPIASLHDYRRIVIDVNDDIIR